MPSGLILAFGKIQQGGSGEGVRSVFPWSGWRERADAEGAGGGRQQRWRGRIPRAIVASATICTGTRDAHADRHGGETASAVFY